LSDHSIAVICPFSQDRSYFRSSSRLSSGTKQDFKEKEREDGRGKKQTKNTPDKKRGD